MTQRRWWLAATAYLAAVWLIGLVSPLITADIFRFPHAIDWDVYVEASQRIGTDELYVWPGGWAWCEHCMFRYTPPFAWLIGLLEPMGVVGWRLLHLAVLPLMGWRLAVVALLAWPFWQDLQVGNVVTIAIVAGVLAMRGNPWGTGTYFAIALLAPRPFLLPLFLWLLWHRPAWRVPVLAAIVAQALILVVTGYIDDWMALILRPNLDLGAFYDYGPARLLGLWWIAIGIPFAVWLTWRGRPGLASLAVQPYWLGYYLLMALIDLWPLGHRASTETPQRPEVIAIPHTVEQGTK